MRKILLFILTGVVVVGLITLLIVKIIQPQILEAKKTNDKLIANAKNLYKIAVNQKKDLSQGPCLGMANDDYVVDLVHVPRTAADDEPNNQCESYNLEQASHFIELDLSNGELVRMK